MNQDDRILVSSYVRDKTPVVQAHDGQTYCGRCVAYAASRRFFHVARSLVPVSTANFPAKTVIKYEEAVVHSQIQVTDVTKSKTILFLIRSAHRH